MAESPDPSTGGSRDAATTSWSDRNQQPSEFDLATNERCQPLGETSVESTSLFNGARQADEPVAKKTVRKADAKSSDRQARMTAEEHKKKVDEATKDRGEPSGDLEVARAVPIEGKVVAPGAQVFPTKPFRLPPAPRGLTRLDFITFVVGNLSVTGHLVLLMLASSVFVASLAGLVLAFGWAGHELGLATDMAMAALYGSGVVGVASAVGGSAVLMGRRVARRKAGGGDDVPPATEPPEAKARE